MSSLRALGVYVCDIDRKEKGGRREKSCRRDKPEWRLDKREKEQYGGYPCENVMGWIQTCERLASFRDVTMGERGENKTQHLAWSQTGSAVRPLETKLL